MPIAKSMTNRQRSKQSERKHDLYQTPPEATLAMANAIALPHMLWEPACGPGAITRILRARGHDVLSTDLGYYDSVDQDIGGMDFLQLKQAPPIGIEAIVTNPPFHLAHEFVQVGLRLVPKVVLLLRLAFLESERRSDILDGGQLELVMPFSNRLQMMHREGWEGKKSSNTLAFAWFVFNRLHTGPTTLKRIKWLPRSRGLSRERNLS